MKHRMPRILLVAWICLASTSLQGLCDDTTYREGIFQVTLPSAWTRMPDSMLDEMRKVMVSGGKELAKASKSADPNEISEKAIPFVTGFQMKSGNTRILLTFAGMVSTEILNRDDMYKLNNDRVRWGIDTGRLRKTSKGGSKLDIDGVPSLLMDIETQSGGRMQSYLFFVPEYPKMTYSMQMICDDLATCEKHAKEFASILQSLKVVRAGGKK